MSSPKKWYCLTLDIRDSEHLPGHLQDILSSFLVEKGSIGSEIKGSSMISYFLTKNEAESAALDSRKLCRNFIELIPNDIQLKTKISVINNEEWVTTWHSYFSPIKISKYLTIIQPWGHYKNRKREKVITIIPQQAFGTGLHESTRLLLRILEKQIVTQKSILDVGTGTGVAAIYAVKLGAQSVLAIDIEETAVQAARQHLRMNKTEKAIKVFKKDIKNLRNSRFNIVMVNMEWKILEDILPLLPVRLISGGKLLLSGILYEQRHEVYRMLKKLGMKHGKPLQEGEWVAFAAYKDE